jgi:cell division protein FtsB
MREVQSDARPADLLRGDAPPDPELERKGRIRRGVVLFLLSVIFLAGSAAALFGERGYLDRRRSRKELDTLQKQVDGQLSRVLELKSEVKRLGSDPAAIERVAREELGLARRGEIQLLLPRDEDWDDLAPPPAKEASPAP